MVVLKWATMQTCAGDELAVDIPQDSPPPSHGHESGAEAPEAPRAQRAPPTSRLHLSLAPAPGPASPAPSQPHPAAGPPAPSASPPPQQVLAVCSSMCRQTASGATLDTATSCSIFMVHAHFDQVGLTCVSFMYFAGGSTSALRAACPSNCCCCCCGIGIWRDCSSDGRQDGGQ